MRRIAALPSVIISYFLYRGADAFLLPVVPNALQLRQHDASNHHHPRTVEGSIRSPPPRSPMERYSSPRREHESAKSSAQKDDDASSSSLIMQREAQELVLSFIATLNKEQGNLQQTMNFFHEESIEFIDSSFYKPVIGKEALVRRVEEYPTSLLHLNGTFHSFNVEGVATAMDTFSDEDVKVAVLYSYTRSHMQDDDSGSSSQKNGVTIYTIFEGKITTVFDVKEESSSGFELFEQVFGNNVVKKEVAKDEGFQHRQIVDAETTNVVSAFFKARNQRDLNATMGMLSDDCSLKSAGMHDWSQDKSVFNEALLSLPDAVTFQIDDLITPSPGMNSGEESVAIRWAIGVHGQRQRFSRGCSFFTVKDGRITAMIDIFESAKQEEFESGLGISPSGLNWLRDYGLGRTIADALVTLSLPSAIMENPTALATFAGLTRDRIHVEYGEHAGQFVDLFLPPDESKRRGLVFFVVSVFYPCVFLKRI